MVKMHIVNTFINFEVQDFFFLKQHSNLTKACILKSNIKFYFTFGEKKMLIFEIII